MINPIIGFESVQVQVKSYWLILDTNRI
jgi:hypothetical protein